MHTLKRLPLFLGQQFQRIHETTVADLTCCRDTRYCRDMTETLLNLAAIEGADHMTSPNANTVDSDGWYRDTILRLVAYARSLEKSQGLLAQERDTYLNLSVQAQCILDEIQDAMKDW